MFPFMELTLSRETAHQMVVEKIGDGPAPVEADQGAAPDATVQAGASPSPAVTQEEKKLTPMERMRLLMEKGN